MYVSILYTGPKSRILLSDMTVNQAYKHPGSQLATETQPQFASKYGDPTNPLVTEGYTGRLASAIKKESLEERQTRKRAKAMQSRATIKRLLPNVSVYCSVYKDPVETLS